MVLAVFSFDLRRFNSLNKQTNCYVHIKTSNEDLTMLKFAKTAALIVTAGLGVSATAQADVNEALANIRTNFNDF